MTKTLCIYHANCADGLLAAWAVQRALGDEVEFVAAKYGDPAHFGCTQVEWERRHPKRNWLPGEE